MSNDFTEFNKSTATVSVSFSIPEKTLSIFVNITSGSTSAFCLAKSGKTLTNMSSIILAIDPKSGRSPNTSKVCAPVIYSSSLVKKGLLRNSNPLPAGNFFSKAPAICPIGNSPVGGTIAPYENASLKVSAVDISKLVNFLK